ncbi:MAG: S8 family serine peptidase [Aureispira sp.]|nr:S8 family serine peptidase [Aureispira sp.]
MKIIISSIILYLTCSTLSIAQQNWRSKIDPIIWQKAQQEGSVEFLVELKAQANTSAARTLDSKEAKGQYVFLQLKQLAKQTQGPIIQLLEQQQVDYQSYYIVNAIKTKGNNQLLEQLAKHEAIARLQSIPRSQLELPMDKTAAQGNSRAPTQIQWGVQRINAPVLWQLNIKGAGVVIGGQDTGYDWVHPALQNAYRGTSTDHNYHWHDAIHAQVGPATTNSCGYDAKSPCDDGSHGTHTMGTMIGDDGAGQQIGVAPEASWIGCRNMDNGWGSLATYVECFEWFLAPTDTNDLNPDPTKAPHVINNSWYCPTTEGCDSSNFHLMHLAVTNLTNAGVVVVVSAGNSGPSCSSIAAPPAIFEEAFAVGATDFVDTLAGFSSKGAITLDSSGRLKPNVVAPGVGIFSSTPNGNYGNSSGTSMAGPHVAGAVALLISADPSLAGQVDSIEHILEMTARPVYSNPPNTCGGTTGNLFPNNMVGYGLIDLDAALQYVRPDLFTATTEVQKARLRIYPNPTKGNITILAPKPIQNGTVQVSNTLGQTLLTQSASFDYQFQLDITALPKGLYYLNVSSDKESYLSTIIKK